MDFKKTEKRIIKRTFRKMFMWYVYRFAKRFGFGRVRKWGKTGVFRMLYCGGGVYPTKMILFGSPGTFIADGTVSDWMSMKRSNIRNDFDVKVVVDHYLSAMLWSSVDKDDVPLENEYTIVDVTTLARETATAVIQRWLDENKTDLIESKLDDENIGHNLWLTTQGHGDGFWSRGLGDVGDRLTKACGPIKESYPYAHNGRVYID